MNYENMWATIALGLSSTEAELQITTGLGFKSGVQLREGCNSIITGCSNYRLNAKVFANNSIKATGFSASDIIVILNIKGLGQWSIVIQNNIYFSYGGRLIMRTVETSLLEKVYEKFTRETLVIQEHIDFMEKSVVLSRMKKNNQYAYKHNLSIENINSIRNKMGFLNQKIKQDIASLQIKIEKSKFYEIPAWFKSIDARSEEGEFVDFIFELIEDGSKDREMIIERVQRNHLDVMPIIEANNIEAEFYLKLYADNEKIYNYIDYCLKAFHNNSIISDVEQIEILRNYEKLLRLIDVKNNINIYRQAFIQLVALFDALVFECFEIQFNINFFEWLKLFDNDNIKLHEIANNNDFGDLKNMIIEKKLKSMSLKDLLDILNKCNPMLFHINGETTYANFREIINRRNCHIHNNGIIDKAYLGIDKNNLNTTFNIYNYNIGDYAEVEKEYIDISLNYCSEFIKKLTQLSD